MTDQELCNIALDFLPLDSCYLKGCWGQELTQAVYDAKLAQYPENANYHNESWIGTDVYPFDCICFIKGITSGATPQNRISYTQLANGPLGDCNNLQFINLLYDQVPASQAPAGYGLASNTHAALSLGGGLWIDCNFDGLTQNGLRLHMTGIGNFPYAGKIPGIDYDGLSSEDFWWAVYYINNVLKIK